MTSPLYSQMPGRSRWQDQNGVLSPPRPMQRRQSRAGACIALALATSCCLTGQPNAFGADSLRVNPNDVKAAFVYNFLKFVEWPASRFGETNGPLVIGVVGQSPIMVELEAAVRLRTVNGRPLVVKAVKRPQDAGTVHLLFFPASEDIRLDDLLPTLAGSGVLTVGESAAFADQGGIINFVLKDGKLRFEINMDSAELAGLKVSAQLQKLAKTIRKK